MLNLDAVRVWRELFSEEDRLLVLGASGWFGRTAMFLTELPESRVLLVGSRDHTIEIHGRRFQVARFDFETVEKFQPTIVLDFWFLTREKIVELGPEEYRRRNLHLIEATARVVSLPSVSRVLSTSSGAAVHEEKNGESGGALSMYGELKLQSERMLREVASQTHASFRLVRVFSVSGALVTRPSDYAFSHLAMQARDSLITVRSTRLVWRRYVAVEDLLVVGLASAQPGFHEVSSGGDLVEIGKLAELFSELAGGCEIRRPELDESEDADNYFSDGKDWDALVASTHVKPISLRIQADNVFSYLQIAQH